MSGTATNSVDYNLSSTTSTIVAGSTSAAITLTPINDTTNETSETIILSASTTDISTTGILQLQLQFMIMFLLVILPLIQRILLNRIQLQTEAAWTNVDGDSQVVIHLNY